MSVELTGVQILAAIGVLLVLVLVWRAGRGRPVGPVRPRGRACGSLR